MPKACAICKTNVTNVKYPGLTCADCQHHYHHNCAKLSVSTLKDIEDNPQLNWSCSKCQKTKKGRRSSILPSVPAPRSTPPTAPETNTSRKPSVADQLLELKAAFESYKQVTDDRIAKLESLVLEKSQEVLTLKSTITQVEEDTAQQSVQIEQFSVEHHLEIQGLPASELDQPEQAAVNVGVSIGCSLAPEDFDCSVNKSSLKPTLQLRFASQCARRRFLHAGKQFNREKKLLKVGDRDYKIFVNEQLTTTQKKLLYEARQFKLAFHFRYAWFSNGQILLKKDETSKPIVIKSLGDIDALARNETGNLLSERQRSPVKDERAPNVHEHQQLPAVGVH